MDNKTLVLTLTLLILGTFAIGVSAVDWEIESGLALTNVTLDKWNDTIDGLNTTFFNDSNPDTTNVEEIDNIDQVSMIYLYL